VLYFFIINKESHAVPDQPKFLKWLKTANRLVIALNRFGLAVGKQHILSIPGRKTGQLYSTPVSVLTVEGRRYIATGGETQWVKNARASGWGYIPRGPKKERIAPVGLPAEARGKVLRVFPRQVRAEVQFFTVALDIRNDPDAFAAAAPQCPVFQVDPLSSEKEEFS